MGSHTLVPKAKDFTEDEIQGLKLAFKRFDKNADGFISGPELCKMLKELGENTTEDACNKMVADYDKDNNGAIDLSEFVELLMHLIGVDDTEEEVIEAFKVFDYEETGRLSVDE